LSTKNKGFREFVRFLVHNGILLLIELIGVTDNDSVYDIRPY